MSQAPVLDEVQTPAQQPLDLRLFRVAALVEALTWAGLLVGMLSKYVVSDNEIGVKVFGPIHGAAFIAYVLATFTVARSHGWSWKLTLVGLAASIPPLLTWPFERYVTRTSTSGVRSAIVR